MSPEELARESIFEGMSAEHLAILAPLFRRVVFATGTEVFTEGEEASELYLLESGRVAVRVAHYDGGQVDLNMVQPGSVWGWSAVMGRSCYSASSVCLSETRALAAPGRDLRRLMQAHPELGRQLLMRITQIASNPSGGLGDQLMKMLGSETGE